MAQLWLVAKAGTDIPFDDQWSAEGRMIYSHWCSGNLQIGDLFRAHNEHRILWTHLWNLFLFVVNGQWDPSVQQLFNIPLRATCAVLIFCFLGFGLLRSEKFALALAVALGFLPFLSWHNVLWGFQSQVWFSIIFSLISLWVASRATSSRELAIAGLAGIAAELAMGSGFLIPVGILALSVARFVIRSPKESPALSIKGLATLGGVLLLLAAALHVNVAQHDQLRPDSMLAFFIAFAKALAWPEFDVPLAALIVGAPFAWLLINLWREKKPLNATESGLIATGFWLIGIAAASAWSRGGSPEFDQALPSRYTDFIVMWPLVNLACMFRCIQSFELNRRRRGQALAVLWSLVIVFCWVGDNAYIIRGIIIPRVHDREAPVRIAREFQLTREPAVFAAKPRLYVPSSSPASILSVLDDPSLKNRLPPSFQPAAKLGFASQIVVFVRSKLPSILWGATGAYLVALLSLLRSAHCFRIQRTNDS